MVFVCVENTFVNRSMILCCFCVPMWRNVLLESVSLWLALDNTTQILISLSKSCWVKLLKRFAWKVKYENCMEYNFCSVVNHWYIGLAINVWCSVYQSIWIRNGGAILLDAPSMMKVLYPYNNKKTYEYHYRCRCGAHTFANELRIRERFGRLNVVNGTIHRKNDRVTDSD